MDSVRLGPLDIRTTPIGFGCARLFREPSNRQRQAVLEEAFERGIRHFDVARMYGLGAAETELGRFARARRSEIVIATKFGISPPPGARLLGRVQAPARRVIRQFPALRSHARRGAENASEPRRYDVDGARASLEDSLKALGTDYIDILFLHEPRVSEVTHPAELVAFLEDAKAEGLVRAWGVSGEATDAQGVAAKLSAGCLVQSHDDVLSREVPGRASASMTYGCLSTALPVISEHFAGDGDLVRRWSEALDVDLASSDALPALLLSDARHANPDGVVLFSTTRADRVAHAVDALTAAAPRTEQFAALSDLVEALPKAPPTSSR